MTDRQLPNGWSLATLGELGHYQNGRAFSDREWSSTGRPIIRIQNLTGTSSTYNYFEGHVDEKHLVRAGDLLVSWAATLGVFVWHGAEAALNQHIFKVTSRVDPAFHRWAVEHTLDELRARSHGSGMVHVTKGVFDSAVVPLPPLQEQSRIANEVERRLSHLEAAERAIQSALRRIRLARSAIEDELLWAPNVPTAWLRDVLQPGGLANGKSVPDREGGFPVLRLTCMKGGVVDLRERKSGAWTREAAKNFLVQAGDFFVIRGNGSLNLVGRGARITEEPDEVAYPDTLIRVRVDQSKMRTDFLALVWNSRKVRQQIEAVAHTTAGIYKVNQKQLSGIQLPCPELDVQEALAQEVSRRLSHLDAADRAIQSQVRRCAAVRASILSAAFTGKLVRQDPADEPATALLARIKEQRAGAIQSKKTTRKPRAKKETTP